MSDVKRRAVRLLCALLAALPLCGCSTYAPEDFSAGSELSDDALDSYAGMIGAGETDKAPAETDGSGKCVVYWTQNGSVWHKSSACRSLQNSQNLSKGSEEDAVKAGKSRCCSVCGE